MWLGERILFMFVQVTAKQKLYKLRVGGEAPAKGAAPAAAPEPEKKEAEKPKPVAQPPPPAQAKPEAPKPTSAAGWFSFLWNNIIGSLQLFV